jgi:hypothetical protein
VVTVQTPHNTLSQSNRLAAGESRGGLRPPEFERLQALRPLALLLNNQSLPPQYQDHPLKGEWGGYREFHIETVTGGEII